MTFLPHRCPTFRTDHLMEPCPKNLARAKALKEAKKHVGPLEKCLECKGKMLITVPLPNKSLDEGRLSTEQEAMVIHPAIPGRKSPHKTVIEGLPAPESWVEKQYVSPERKGWEPHPEVTTAPVFLKDVYHPVQSTPDIIVNLVPKMRPLSPEKVKKTREAVQRMGERYRKEPKRPELPQLSPEKEETYHRIMEKQEKIVQEVAKEADIGPGKEIFTKQEAINRGVMPLELAESIFCPTQAPRYCPTHPKVIQRIDKLGRWMGMCAECLAARGKKCGKENFEKGVTAPPMSIPLNLPKYAELKAWLIEQADENERNMTQQIMYILKTARRQGT